MNLKTSTNSKHTTLKLNINAEYFDHWKKNSVDLLFELKISVHFFGILKTFKTFDTGQWLNENKVLNDRFESVLQKEINIQSQFA